MTTTERDLAKRMIKSALHPPGARRYPAGAKNALATELDAIRAKAIEAGTLHDSTDPDEIDRFWRWWHDFQQKHK